ncbi:MAG: hypothetical protein AAGJ53_05395 [Pseudomonadota bacterium]
MTDADRLELDQLEQSWIDAEAEADAAKARAARAEAAARELKQMAAGEEPELLVLMGQASAYADAQTEAERNAEAAFDRFWNARGANRQAF